MIRSISLTIVLFFIATILFAQQNKLYDPNANAAANIELAIKKAGAENKFVLIQAGGNWCSWCLEFARFSKADQSIDAAIKSNFIWYHLNFSKENTNEILFAKYGYPQRFGFPVFLILNSDGKLIHTQSSEYLEDGKKSYDAKKVLNFLQQWSPKALNPATYLKQ